MTLEKQNINIPFGNGVDDDEDKYLLKSPNIEASNVWYDKENSLTKRGRYQFLQAGFTPSAMMLDVEGVLNVLDKKSLFRFEEPSIPPIITNLEAFSSATPCKVDPLPITNEGCYNPLIAEGQQNRLACWVQPGPTPSEPSTLWYSVYDKDGLLIFGPSMVTPTPPNSIDLIELSLVFAGGYYVLSGIGRFDGELYAACIPQAAPQTQSTWAWTIIYNAEPVQNYDITTDPTGTSFWYVIQTCQDASSNIWGDTIGIRANVVSNTLVTDSPVLLGSFASSPNRLGDKAIACLNHNQFIWVLVASARHNNIYIYRTNLNFGSITTGTLVHTYQDDEPHVNGGYTQLFTSFPSASVIPAYGPLIWSNDRTGRLALAAGAEGDSTGVIAFWSGPVINSSFNNVVELLMTGNLLEQPVACGVAWKNVDGAFNTGSLLGSAPASHLNSKPFNYLGEKYIILETSLNSFGYNPDVPTAESVFFREGVWKMGQLCAIRGQRAVPVSQFGEDGLVDTAFGLHDQWSRRTSPPYDEPRISIRRPQDMRPVDDKFIAAAAYLVRPDIAVNSIGSSTFHDAKRYKGVFMEFSPQETNRSYAVAANKNIVISNGWLSIFDGGRLQEASPNFIPSVAVVDWSGSLGAVTNDFNIGISWAIIGAENKLLRSGVSTRPVERDSGNALNNMVAYISRPPPSISREMNRERVELWTPQGTSPSDFWTGNPNARSRILDRSEDPEQFRINLPVTIGGDVTPLQPGLGAALPPEPAGSSVYATVSQNRIWYVSPEDVARVRFSKDFAALGYIEFNRALYVDIPDGSRPVAVTTLDEQVIILTTSGIFLVRGTLPNNSGGGANFTLQKLQFEEGCTNRYSVFSTRKGVFFESARGLNLLTRGYEVQFIGEAVEEDLNGGTSITGASYLPDYDIYLFTTKKKVMCFHGTKQKWTKWNLSELPDGEEINSSVSWGKYHVILTTAGILYYMDMEDKLNVRIEMATPWISIGQILGFQRMRDINLLGRIENSSVVGRLVVGIAYDYNESFTEAFTYNYEELSSLVPLKIRLKPRKQKSTAFKLLITEFPIDVGQNQILRADTTIAGISVEVGTKMLGNKKSRTSNS